MPARLSNWLAAHPTDQGRFLGRTRPSSPVLFLFVVAALVVSYCGTEVHSCQRTNATHAADQRYFDGVATRALTRADIETGPKHDLDMATYHAAQEVAARNRQLDCSLPAPDTH